MTSDKYWESRTELEKERTDRTIETLQRKMETLYTGATQRIEKEIESFYARYADKTGMTIADVNKKLNDPELRRFKIEMKQYYDEVNKYKQYKHGLAIYKKELDYLSGRAYISRLEDLKIQLKHQAVKLGLDELGVMDKALGDLYQDTFDHQYFNVDKTLGFSNGYTGLNTKIIDKALSKTWLGENYSDRIWKNKAKLLTSIETSFMQGLAMGKGVKDIAKEVSANCGVSYRNALRLVTTESGHIANEATFDSYQEHEVEQYKYVADLSEKTCPICGALDGEVFKMSEKQEGVNYPEMHPNCRCTTIAYYEPDELSDELKTTRIAKDEDGKWFDVPSDMTYNQWHDIVYSWKPEVIEKKFKPEVKTKSTIKTSISSEAVRQTDLSMEERFGKSFVDFMEKSDDFWNNYEVRNFTEKEINDILFNLDLNTEKGLPFDEKKKIINDYIKSVDNYINHKDTVFARNNDLSDILDNLDNFKKDPRLKTQFETGTSKGSLSKNLRNEWEQNLNPNSEAFFASNKNNKLRPVYGEVTHRSDKFYAKGYGDTAFILSDEARSRASITLGNSSGMQISFKKSAERILSVKDSYEVRRTFSYSSGCFDANRNGSDLELSRGRWAAYIEFQCWGGIDFSKGDISEIIIKRETYKDYKEKYSNFNEFEDLMKKYNIKLNIAD